MPSSNTTDAVLPYSSPTVPRIRMPTTAAATNGGSASTAPTRASRRPVGLPTPNAADLKVGSISESAGLRVDL
ncbi:hypothetical protein I546_6062 [Mycobacterium kansasii 732]|nr:hypothetical protein I546_6062 [Mycobacterium kansasii 732]